MMKSSSQQAASLQQFPFGNEQGESVRLLFRFFCNNLYLGQFELVRACVAQLASQGPQFGVDIGQILKQIVEYPYERSLGSSQLKSPHHLSWMCLQEYLKLEIYTLKDSEVDSLKRDVEFRMLLSDASCATDSNTIQELYIFHKLIHASEQEPLQTDAISQTLSQRTCNFLKELLLSKPELSSTIIGHLKCPDKPSLKLHHIMMDQVYINCIIRCISALSQDGTAAVCQQDRCEQLYNILSLFDPENEAKVLNLSQMVTGLVQLCESDCLSEERLLSLMAGKKKPFLLKQLSDEIVVCRMQQMVSCSPTFKHAELTESQRQLLTLSLCEDRSQSWRQFYFMCTKNNQHCFEIIMNTAIHLIRSGKFDELRDLFHPAELHPLKPLVLLTGWPYCYTCTNAKRLLEILWDNKAPCRHPALDKGCQKLQHQINLIQWCLEKSRSLVHITEGDLSPVNPHCQATNIFQGLVNHSMLYVLQQATRLASLREHEVLDLLQRISLNKTAENDAKKTKMVRFEDVEDYSDSANELLGIDQERDVALYRSFCILKNVQDTILYGAMHAHSKLMNPTYYNIQSSSRHRSWSKDSTLSDASESSSRVSSSAMGDRGSEYFQWCSEFTSGDVQMLYDKNVTQKLQNVKQHLLHLYPLAYRVEILENIFSLLFVSHKDLQDPFFAGETDDTDGSDEKQSVHGSNENLMNASIQSEEESLVSDTTCLTPLAECTVPARGSESVDYDVPFVDEFSTKEQVVIENSDLIETEVFTDNKPLVGETAKSVVRETAPETTLPRFSTDSKSDTHSPKVKTNVLSGKPLQIGLLTNEYLVRDILGLLQESLIALSSAHFQLIANGSNEVEDSSHAAFLEENLTQILPSSITPATLKSRISRLSQVVSEALWRFQLVSNDQIPREFGKILLQPLKPTSDYTDVEIDDVCDYVSTKKNNRVSYLSEVSPMSGEDSETRDSTGTCTDSTGLLKPSKKLVKRSRPRPRTPSMSSAASVSRRLSSGIIQEMLLSNRALLIKCLKQGKLVEANQVIKLFKMEESAEVAEVGFLEAFSKAVKQMQALCSQGNQGPSMPERLPMKDTMKQLASVAAAGIATATISTCADELLSIPVLPFLPKPKNIANLTPNYVAFFNPDNLSAMILFDLACSASCTYGTSNMLLDSIQSRMLAKKKSQLGKEFGPESKSGKECKVLGFPAFLDLLESRVQLSDNSETCAVLESTPVLNANFPDSIQSVLMSASFPFLPTRCKCYLESMKEIKKAVVTAWDQFQVERSYSSAQKKYTWKHKRSKQNSGKLKNSENLYSVFEDLLLKMEQHRHNIGMYSFLTRSLPPETMTTEYRNYLLNLYKHVQVMVNLFCENELKPADCEILKKNCFKVLEEGPVVTLGRLMFSKRIPPYKLEKVAEELSINLTHVIVHNCCPKILSKHQPPNKMMLPCQEIGSSGAVIVLNNRGVSSKSTDSGEKLVGTILTNLVYNMKELSQKHNGKIAFNIDCLQEAIKSAQISKTLDKTVVLRDVDLDALNQQELICFLTNLTNLLIVHSYLYMALQAEHLQCWKDLKELFHSGHHCGLGDENNSIDRIVWLNRFAYQVGQLGIVTIFDLRYILLRNGLPCTGLLRGLLEDRIDSLDECDPWLKYAPHPDYRIMFAISDGCAFSPPLQVLTPEWVSHHLEVAEKAFLSNTVSVNISPGGNCTVSIPELLIEYQNDLPSEEETANGYFNAPWKKVILYIRKYAETDLSKRLEDLMAESGSDQELPFQVFPETSNTKFLYIFDATQLQKQLSEKAERSNTVSCNQEMDLKYSRSSSKIESDLPAFKLTSNALEYIKTESPFVATLVSLVCNDDLDNNDDHFSEDNLDEEEDEENSWMKKNRSSLEMSLVDIKSFRYQKLSVDYPVLKQHILQNIIPLAQVEHPEIILGEEALLKFMSFEIPSDIKISILSLYDSKKFLSMVSRLLNKSVHAKKWEHALNVIDSLPVTMKQENGEFLALQDFVLCCLAKKSCEKQDKRLESYVKKIRNSELQARTVLNVITGLPLKSGIELLELCLSKELTPRLSDALRNKLKQQKIFFKISQCVTQLEKRCSVASTILKNKRGAELQALMQKLSCWKDLSQLSRSNADDVLKVILESNDFDAAREWAEFYSVKPRLFELIERKQIMYYLCRKPSDPKSAFMALEKMQAENEEKCLKICNQLLENLTQQKDILFTASYMLNYLETKLNFQDQEKLRLTCIGAKALLCLPKAIRGEYRHLVSAPQLLLEQLLMNMKADLAGQVFSKIQNDFRRIPDSNSCFTVKDFNDLVAKYATKALEFSIVQVSIQGRERSQSRLSLMSDRQELDSVSMVSRNHHSETGFGGTRLRRRGSDTSLNRSSSRNVDSPQHRSVGAVGGKYLPLNYGDGTKFVMPSEPPTKDQWVPDSATAVCMACKVERFSMFNRRHHCRRCGRVVCRGCSSRNTLIFGMVARTCNDCFDQMSKPSVKDEPERYAHRSRDTYSGASCDDSSNFSPTTNGFFSKENPGSLDLAGAIRHTEHHWKLKLDPDYNSTLLEEFYYEQAPSASLCISLLNLHSDPKRCGELILELCDDLSKLLKPISPGMANNEVDYSLVISMMRHLLFHAKVRFTKCMENRLMVQCDQYSTLVDLLKVLLASNYPDLPSIQELTKTESVTRLRDKLIEVERLPLAMEVSTKCGLDPTGVWAAWGRACLKFRNYSLAREKFAHCLKPPRDRNMTQHTNNLLTEVVECLESMPNRENTERYSEDSNLDKVRFEECAHYLKTYGTYTMVVDFFRRNGHWLRATRFILEYQCSPDVFEESLLVPALQSGNLHTLLDHMLLIDTTLEKWGPYFTSMCRYLVNHKFYHVLYGVQLFMKDFIRASVTCTRYFFLGSAQSYRDLASRINFLQNAEQHLHSYLEPSHWGNVPRPQILTNSSPGATPQRSVCLKSSMEMEETAVRLAKSPAEIKKQIFRINLQIEVTKFLEACLNRADSSAANVAVSHVASHKYGPPTLFGNTQVRIDLVTMVLMSCDSCDDDRKKGFEIALKIIKEYKLDKKTVFCHAGRGLVKLHRYDDIKYLVNWITIMKLGDSKMCDAVIDACMVGIADQRHTFSESQIKESGSLIDCMKADSNKINAYILLGKLKTAYLLAVKSNNIEEIKHISREAGRLGQMAVKSICDRYLLQQNP